VTGAAYSAHQVSEHTRALADGGHVGSSVTERQYRDFQGRTRTERPLGTEQREGWLTIVEVRDPVAGFGYVLDDQNRIAHRFTMGPPPTKKIDVSGRLVTPGAASQPHGSTENLGSQSMEGLVVEGVRFTRIYPIGSQDNDRPLTETVEVWTSAELHLEVLAKTTSARNGETVRRLTNINRAEPDPSLFQPPADYAIVDEKDLFTMTLKKRQ
jgi:hypothetical protein